MTRKFKTHPTDGLCLIQHSTKTMRAMVRGCTGFRRHTTAISSLAPYTPQPIAPSASLACLRFPASPNPDLPLLLPQRDAALPVTTRRPPAPPAHAPRHVVRCPASGNALRLMPIMCLPVYGATSFDARAWLDGRASSMWPAPARSVSHMTGLNQILARQQGDWLCGGRTSCMQLKSPPTPSDQMQVKFPVSGTALSPPIPAPRTSISGLVKVVLVTTGWEGETSCCSPCCWSTKQRV